MALKSRLTQIATALPHATDKAAQLIAELVEQTAVGGVAVDTGALRTSIEIFGAAGSGERIVSAGQSLDYADFLEYGTSKAAAQPFMTPAGETGRRAAPRIVEKAVLGAIK